MSELVDIGWRQLEVAFSGAKHPTVVFESGAGSTASDWDVVRGLLNPDQATFAYSRAGQGKSDPPEPANVVFDDGEIQVAAPESRTTDLEEALEVTGTQPPYVLVGHSLGGIFIRLFAARHPESVAGLVFVDSSHPEQVERTQKAVRASDVPESSKDEHCARVETPNAPVIRAAVDSGPFDVPIAVISRDPQRVHDPVETGIPQDHHVMYERIWEGLQAELTGLSPFASHVVAKGAGHNVHRDCPELVAQTITQLIQGIGSDRSTR